MLPLSQARWQKPVGPSAAKRPRQGRGVARRAGCQGVATPGRSCQATSSANTDRALTRTQEKSTAVRGGASATDSQELIPREEPGRLSRPWEAQGGGSRVLEPRSSWRAYSLSPQRFRLWLFYIRQKENVSDLPPEILPGVSTVGSWKADPLPCGPEQALLQVCTQRRFQQVWGRGQESVCPSVSLS